MEPEPGPEPGREPELEREPEPELELEPEPELELELEPELEPEPGPELELERERERGPMKKQAAKLAIARVATITCTEDELALAVVMKAISDVGLPPERGGVEEVDSTSDIKNGGLNAWLDLIGVEIPYFHRILRETGVLK